MSFTTLLANSLIGFVLVFLVLLVLMAFIAVMNKAFSSRKSQEAPAAAQAPAIRKEIPEVVLNNVSERDAAMIMAIVADESGIPLEELRFISIREVKKDEV